MDEYTPDCYLRRPGEEDDEGNQDAYDEDEYGDDYADEADDDNLDIF